MKPEPVDRRSFLRVTALAGGGLLLGIHRGAAPLAAAGVAEPAGTGAPLEPATLSAYVRITPNAALRRNDRDPRLPVIVRPVRVRSHVAKGMAIEGRKGSGWVMRTCLNPRNPGTLWQPGNIANDIGPRLSGITRDLQITVVCACPDQLSILR